jgi:hypothetical protein
MSRRRTFAILTSSSLGFGAFWGLIGAAIGGFSMAVVGAIFGGAAGFWAATYALMTRQSDERAERIHEREAGDRDA